MRIDPREAELSPARREAWIKANAPAMDALLVNPNLVETGLELVMFSDLTFYETTVSLYTLWQSMRRVWRFGQDKDVHVTFLAYTGTMGEEILRRMGVKLKYAQLLYGKEAAGCMVEVDNDYVQREIIQAALQGQAFKSASDAVQSIFGNSREKTVHVSTAPTGSPVAASAVVVTVTHF